jgi:hypothetical protein
MNNLTSAEYINYYKWILDKPNLSL